MASTGLILGAGALGLGGLYFLPRPKAPVAVAVGAGGAAVPVLPTVGGVAQTAAQNSAVGQAQLGLGITSGILGLIPGVVGAASSIGGLFSSSGSAAGSLGSSSSSVGGTFGSLGSTGGGSIDEGDLGGGDVADLGDDTGFDFGGW